MVHAHIVKVYAEKSGLWRYATEASKIIAQSLGGEFITHKYIPSEYDGQFYGAMAMKDNSLLLLPTNEETGLLVLRKVGGKIEEYNPI